MLLLLLLLELMALLLATAAASAAAGRLPLYVKCLAVGPQLLVHWVAGAGSSGGGGGGQEPHTLELDSAAFTTEAGAVPACYRDTPQLVAKLRSVGAAGGCGCSASNALGATRAMHAGGQRGQPSPAGARQPLPCLWEGLPVGFC